MPVRWLEEIRSADIETVGGKGASLGELTAAGLPVPPAFIVTAGSYRSFIEETGIDTELFDAVDIESDDSGALATAEARAEELIMGTAIPDSLREEIEASYRAMDGEPFVAVRSSATAEDLPDASFAGQQETFLNVTLDQLVERVKQCWASLFTKRAIYYRNEQGFDHQAVDIAVVVQEMVDAEKSGVMFTSHPSTGDPRLIIEAAWGLGEAVVSGTVSPDNYVVERQNAEIVESTIADKKQMMVRDEASGETTTQAVPAPDRERQVLTEAEIESLVTIGAQAESHYGDPQDIEWALVDGELFMLQSRPITTIREVGAGSNNVESVADGSGQAMAAGEMLVRGLGASPGTASGEAQLVGQLDQLDKVGQDDIIVTEMTTPDMVPAMKRAGGIVTDEGGMTSHAAIVSRELGVPAVVGTGNGSDLLADGQTITIDGDKGSVTVGRHADGEESEPDEHGDVRPQNPVKPMTATEVKVNVSIAEAAHRAAQTGADGVGLLRMEHMILSTGETPEHYVEQHGEEAYVDMIVEEVRGVADEFYPRSIRVRTLDAPTDEFRQLEGGEQEHREHNPMLGYRGIRRSLDRPRLFNYELEAFRRLYEMGYDNVEIMFPLVNDASDVRGARRLLEASGIDPTKRNWGVMVETPAAALGIEGLAEAGIDFASFGTNDLTQYTLAVDRNNEHVADRFDELHPAVLSLIGDVIESCREHDVATSICGQAGSNPEMVRFLVEAGVTSISANIDAVRDVQHEVKRVEQQLILESIR
jgi:pyruvate,water dikinase